MKGKVKTLIMTVSVLLASSVAYADDDVRIGYAELPQKAKSFIEKHFGADTPTHEIEYENMSGVYTVELRNGYDIKFNSDGKVIEIDSPDREDIAESIVKEILPAKAVVYLKDKGILDDVDEIRLHRNGDFMVEIDKIMNDTKIRFDSIGNVVHRKR